MPRNKNIRKVIGPIIEALCQVYDETNPELGRESEICKLQGAQYAFDLYWILYGQLMIWAQNQIIGYEQAREDRPTAQFIAATEHNGRLTVDSHNLEFLGAFSTIRAPYKNIKTENRFLTISDKLDSHISDAGLRRAMVKMLLSDDLPSAPIRNRLIDAFDCIEHGQSAILFQPDRLRRRGKSYDLDQTKSGVIMHLCYLEAKGFKTYRALEMIGEEIAVSPETIRSWKKELSHKDWFRFLWNCGHIAGKYEETLLSNVDDGVDEGVLAHVFKDYGPHQNVLLSKDFLNNKNGKYSLKTLKDKLNRYRQ